MLGHQREGAREPPQLVLALQSGLGAQVTRRHLAHPFGQHQQGPRQLVTQQHRQQHRTKHGQKQAQRQRAHIHAPQPAPGQRTLLVFAVGFLHRNGIGYQRGRQGQGGLQVARLHQQAHAGTADQGQHLDPRVLRRSRVGNVVQPFDLRRGALLARRAQQGSAGPLGVEAEPRLPCAGHRLTGRVPEHHIGRAQLVANALQYQACSGIGHLGHLGTGVAGFGGHVGGQRVQRHAGQVDARRQRPFHLHVEPAFNGARDELVRHHIDQQPRHEPHQRKDGRQLDQQATAKAPLAQAQAQAHRHPAQHQQQQQRHKHVDAKQPGVVALVQHAVVGGQRQQEQQHQTDGGHDGRPDAHGPAHCTGLAGGGVGRCRSTGWQRGSAHLAGSAPRRWLRETSRFQPDRPTAPIWKGRGNCEMSRRKRKFTVCTASGSITSRSAIFQRENR